MPCNEFINLTGCGDCYIHINDEINISRLSNESISTLLNNIILTCHFNNDKKLHLSSTKVRCDGIIIPSYDNGNLNFEYKHNRNLCREILLIWFRSHQKEIDNSILVVYLSTVLSTLLSDKSDNQLIRNADNFSRVKDIVSKVFKE
jgi:hypothetical protein